MKRTQIFALLIFMTLFSTPLLQTQGYNVGDSFRYIVQTASGEFSYNTGSGPVSGTTDKFRVGDTAVDEGSELEVRVTNKESSSVDFDIYDNSSAKLTSSSSSGIGFALSLIVYSLYPMILLGLSSGSVNPIDVTKGVSLGDSWYLAPESISWSGIFDTYNESDNWSSYYAGLTDNEASLSSSSSARYEDGGETIIFELAVIGQYMISMDNTDLTFIHNMEFHYSVNNYYLRGYYLTSNVDGQLDGYETDFHMTISVKEKEYTRKVGIPIVGIFIGLLCSSLLIITSKRKRK